LQIDVAVGTCSRIRRAGNRERAGAPLAVEVPEITLMIKEVRVFDSMVAIYKTQQRHLPRSVAY
jgi:hypothetical protein